MTEMVTLTLTGAKRFMIAGTSKTVLQWEQVRVDPRTAEHLLDQYFVDKNNQELPYFEEGVKTPPPLRSDRKRVRASQRRLDREAARADAEARSAEMPDAAENYDKIRGDGKRTAQDPYKRRSQRGTEYDDFPPINDDVVMETEEDRVRAKARNVQIDTPRHQPVVQAAKAPAPKAAKKTSRKRGRKAA